MNAKISEARIGLRLSGEHRALLQRIAAATGEPLSAVARRALANGLRFEERTRR